MLTSWGRYRNFGLAASKHRPNPEPVREHLVAALPLACGERNHIPTRTIEAACNQCPAVVTGDGAQFSLEDDCVFDRFGRCQLAEDAAPYEVFEGVLDLV